MDWQKLVILEKYYSVYREIKLQKVLPMLPHNSLVYYVIAINEL